MNWNHIIIEGFCAKNWEYKRKHGKFDYIFENGKFTKKKVPNAEYDPNVKKPKRPKYCEKKICSVCIKCKYLAYGDIDEELDMKLKGVIRKYMCSEELNE